MAPLFPWFSRHVRVVTHDHTCSYDAFVPELVRPGDLDLYTLKWHNELCVLCGKLQTKYKLSMPMTDGSHRSSTMHILVSWGPHNEPQCRNSVVHRVDSEAIASDVRSRINLSNVQGGSKWTYPGGNLIWPTSKNVIRFLVSSGRDTETSFLSIAELVKLTVKDRKHWQRTLDRSS